MKTSAPYFLILTFKDRTLQTLFDAIRIICNNSTSTKAHITLRGPYEYGENESKKQIEKWESVLGQVVFRIEGPASIINKRQSTVFLEVRNDYGLEEMWERKYGFIEYLPPHITLYDGDDQEFANSLFDVVNSYKFDFSFYASKIEKHYLKDRNNPIIFNLVDYYDFSYLSYVARKEINRFDVFGSSKENKIMLIDHLCMVINNFYSQEINLKSN